MTNRVNMVVVGTFSLVKNHEMAGGALRSPVLQMEHFQRLFWTCWTAINVKSQQLSSDGNHEPDH